jgi:transcriptional regulator with XRE-family HTH domain
VEWDCEKFGNHLSSLLDAKKMSQAQLAAAVGLSQSAVSLWSHKNEPPVSKLLKVAEKLEVTPCYLAFGWAAKYGSEFEPMDDAERDLVEAMRLMKDNERDALAAYLKTTVEGRTEVKKPGTRTRKKKLEITADYDMKLTALAVDDASLEQQRHLSEKLLLSREESQALFGFAAQQLDAGRLEHPLTRALRKIATLLSHGIVPAELPPGAAAFEERSAPPEAASPTQDTPERQAPHPVSSHAVSPSSAPRKKKGKQL